MLGENSKSCSVLQFFAMLVNEKNRLLMDYYLVFMR